jgi:hypothetical protein
LLLVFADDAGTLTSGAAAGAALLFRDTLDINDVRENIDRGRTCGSRFSPPLILN